MSGVKCVGMEAADLILKIKTAPVFDQNDKTPEEIWAAEEEPVLIEWSGVRDANGSGGLNEDTARTLATVIAVGCGVAILVW